MSEPVWKSRSREERIQFYRKSQNQRESEDSRYEKRNPYENGSYESRNQRESEGSRYARRNSYENEAGRYEDRNLHAAEKKRYGKKKYKNRFRKIISLLALLTAFLAGVYTGKGCGENAIAAVQGQNAAAEGTSLTSNRAGKSQMTDREKETADLPDYVDEQYLTINPYSRPGKKTDTIHAVVIHYLANPGTTAQQNRDYFEELSLGEDGVSISSNFVIGLEGEVIACVPPGEVAYASNNRNSDTVSIENCHPDETGKFTQATYESLVKLTGWLCCKYQLDPLNGGVIRHYEVTGKICPKYFVEHEDAWQAFLQDVQEWIDENQ